MIADYHQSIIDAVPGLTDKLERAGVRQWLAAQRKVTVDGRIWFVLAGDRIASEPEAMLTFASEKGLATREEIERAGAARPLPADVDTVDVKIQDQGEK